MTIRLQNLNQDIPKIIQHMADSGIDTRPGFTAMSKMQYIAKKSKINNPLVNSESLSKTLISLPTYPSLNNRQISEIVQALSEALQVDPN
jgi:dTDP-4-amino-4,6-dideoxygalactose transaminase